MTALRAFDAVARHLNFRKAAVELNVTHAAVSHQIKALEAELGATLLERTSRSARLTKTGEAFFAAVTDGLETITQGVRGVREQAGHDVLHVQSYGSFISMWLTPRLSEFQQQNSGLHVRLISSFEDFGTGGFDVGIFKTLKNDEKFLRRELFRTQIFPVCLASSLGGTTLPADPNILAHHKLLNVPANESEQSDWDVWAEAAGITKGNLGVHTTFDTYPIARDAVLKGMGIAMARHPFVADDLQSERLIRPFAASAAEPGSWHLYVRKQIASEPRVRTFCSWLVSEVQRDPTCLPAGSNLAE